MTENLGLYLKIITMVAGIFAAYHKYIMSELNKKMNKDECSQQQRILDEKRSKLELLIIERTKTIFEQQKEVREDLRIIKEKIIEK